MQVSRKMLIGIAAMAMSAAACGSSSGGDTGGSTAVIGTDFPLVFSPMYTAYDGVHDFKVPVVPQGGITVDKWEIADAKGVVQKPGTVADITPEPSYGGAMIKTKKGGDWIVLAHAGKQTGSAPIHITQVDPSVWTMGEARYNNTIMLASIIPMGGMAMSLPKDISCKNCHGEGAMFLDVQHTPQQTGGYSDDELKKIITMGMKPAGAVSKTGVPLAIYQWFHTWMANDAEQMGLVVYLRSLDPKSQGMLDFGGLMPPGGGQSMMGAAGSAP
jgi:hypothetical protein